MVCFQICPACRLVCNCSDHQSRRIAKLTQPQPQTKTPATPLAQKPAAPRKLMLGVLRMPLQNENDDDGVYYVEKIVEKRENAATNQVEYFCKFESWPDNANAWLTENQLKLTCQDLIDAFASGNTAVPPHDKLNRKHRFVNLFSGFFKT